MYWVALPLPTPLKPLSPLFPLREHLFLLLLLLLLCHFPAPHSSPSSSSDPLSGTPVPAAARMSSNGICARTLPRTNAAHCAHCRAPTCQMAAATGESRCAARTSPASCPLKCTEIPEKYLKILVGGEVRGDASEYVVPCPNVLI